MKVDLKEYRSVEEAQATAPAGAFARALSLRHKFPGASTGLLAIFDQAIVSGTGFATAAVIGRMTAPETLGLYYLTLTIVLIVVGVQDQIVAAPYLVYARRRHGDEHALFAGSSWFHHFVLTMACVATLLLAIGILSFTGSPAILPGLWALAVAGPLLLVREDIRRFAFADLHLRSAIAVDAAVAVLQLGGLFLLGYYGHLTLFNIFLVMGGACALAALGWLLIDPPRVRFSRARIRDDWSHNWSFAKWALRGHLLSSNTPYIMIWIVNAAIGPVAAGVLGACTTLVGVTKVIQAGVTNVLTTQSSHAFATGGWSELCRVMIRAALFLGLSGAGFCLLFLLAGDALAVFVYGEFFQDCGPILVALALAALVSSLSIVIGNGLWAIDRPRASFAADLCCTVITLGAAAVLVPSLGALGAALATLAGSVVATLVRLVILIRAYTPARFSETPAVPVTSHASHHQPPRPCPSMSIRSIKFDQLTSDELAAWSEIQLAHEVYSSPYFRPEFTRAVANVRDDVEVAVLEEGGQAVGFLPFQRTAWNAGRPIAGRLSDYHALVAAPETPVDPVQLVRACRLASWHFDHLVDAHGSFAKYAWSHAESPYIDVSEGFEAYMKQRGSTRGVMSEYGQKKRKLEREVGPVRYERHVADRSVLAKLIEWKTEQYVRTKVDNIFAFPWVINLLEEIMQFDSPHIAPVMSVTYCGDEIAAINFGMRAGTVLHPWFPAYNVNFGKYSPGTLHWVATLQDAEAMGVKRIDLVSGGETYKQRFSSGTIRVAQGAIDPRPSVAAARRAWRRTREYVRSTPVYSRVRGPVRMLHNVKAWLELR